MYFYWKPFVIMKEAFLQFIWRTKRFNLLNLKTTQGLPITIGRIGQLNRNAGPDFLNAQIKIGRTLWYGNVEIHLSASDWYRHGHHLDPIYENVILHVVLEEDQVVKRKDQSVLPCLELKPRIHSKVIQRYQDLQESVFHIPCYRLIHQVEPEKIQIWLEQCGVERLMAKTKRVQQLLYTQQNNWTSTFLILLGECLGQKVNGSPMRSLMENLPLQQISFLEKDTLDLEALLFGIGGMLEGAYTDQYPNILKKRYAQLSRNQNWTILSPLIWRWSRLRPLNFPSLRIAQYAALLSNTTSLFHQSLSAKNWKELFPIYRVKASKYWDTHYLFDRPSTSKSKYIGKGTINRIIINVLVPLLFHYGEVMKMKGFKDKAIEWLEDLGPENNHIVKQWENMGIAFESALHTQAILQLHHFYCEDFKCLDCAIGNALLRAENGK